MLGEIFVRHLNKRTPAFRFIVRTVVFLSSPGRLERSGPVELLSNALTRSFAEETLLARAIGMGYPEMMSPCQTDDDSSDEVPLIH